MIDNFTDSHAHLTSDGVYPEIDAILERAQSAGVKSIVNICTDIKTLERGLLLERNYPWIHNTASTTPHDVDKEGELFFPVVKREALAGNLVAIGETGLDYYYEHSPRELQKEFFVRYLHLALECQLPVVIHCRDAFDDFFEIIDREYPGPGVLHCFTGTFEEAQEVVKRGWYLSLSGIVTFKKSEELRKVAEMVPLEQLLIETDTPYLAPQKYRGKPNEPGYLPYVAETVAQVKGLSVEAVAQQTSLNVKNLFKIRGPES